jgi:hypothetical protein
MSVHDGSELRDPEAPLFRLWLRLIEVSLHICASSLNQRKHSNGYAAYFGELDQMVQVGAKLMRGIDTTGTYHLALPSQPELDEAAD